MGGWVGVKFVAVQCDLNNRKRWEQVDGTVFSRWQEQVILCVFVCGEVGGWVGVGVGANFVAMKCDLNERKRWEQVDDTVLIRWQEQVTCLCVCMCVCVWLCVVVCVCA